MNEELDIERCEPYRLSEALMHSGKFIELKLDAALAPIGLTTAKWNVLRHLAQAEGQLPLGQLAAKLSCVKSNATQLIDRLEAENLVRRVPDREDRRSIRAELTNEGKMGYEAGLKIVRAFERQLWQEYQPEEQRLLQGLLTRLAAFEAEGI
jgi:DNA-binding MarR family transcriptional regulator